MAKFFDFPFAQNGDKEEVPMQKDALGWVSFDQGFGPDYEKDLLLDPNAKDIERKKLNWLLYTITERLNYLAEYGGSVVGVPIPYPSTKILEGFVPYDGRTFDTSANPQLAALFPNGQLPDLRGLFIRGLDMGKGIDPGRAILSLQEDAMQQITGHFPVANRYRGSFAGCFWTTSSWNTNYKNGGSDDWGKIVNFDNAKQARVATENRPKNMAFYYITKVG